MSTLLPSFIVFLELKQAKFFWSVLLIFGKTEAFLFHFLYSSCLSLTHSVFHRLYIILYIWDAVFSMCGTNFHNGRAYNRTVGLGSHFLCLLRGGDAESHCTWNVLCSFYQLHHRSDIGGDLGSGSGYAKGGNTVYEAICLFCNPGDPVVGCGGRSGKSAPDHTVCRPRRTPLFPQKVHQEESVHPFQFLLLS